MLAWILCTSVNSYLFWETRNNSCFDRCRRYFRLTAVRVDVLHRYDIVERAFLHSFVDGLVTRSQSWNLLLNRRLRPRSRYLAAPSLFRCGGETDQKQNVIVEEENAAVPG